MSRFLPLEILPLHFFIHQLLRDLRGDVKDDIEVGFGIPLMLYSRSLFHSKYFLRSFTSSYFDP